MAKMSPNSAFCVYDFLSRWDSGETMHVAFSCVVWIYSYRESKARELGHFAEIYAGCGYYLCCLQKSISHTPVLMQTLTTRDQRE